MSNENSCNTCSGSGLINPIKVCDSCEGTGKLKNKMSLSFYPQDYPEGTNVVTADGTYLIQKGEAIKQ